MQFKLTIKNLIKDIKIRKMFFLSSSEKFVMEIGAQKPQITDYFRKDVKPL